MELKDKVVLITGGARIGQEVATYLAERRCHIVLAYRSSRSAAERTAEKVRSMGRRALTVQADFMRERDVRRVMGRIEKEMKRLDVLINMASVYKKIPLFHIKSTDWEESLTIHLRAAYHLSHEAARLMRTQKQGRSINFSDWTSRSGRPRYRDYVPYYVAKTGIIGLTEALALELAPEILVNAIAPGPILPPDSIADEEKQEVVSATPLKRWGGSLEIAKTVSFLIETDFVTGECIRVDGGRHLY
ncbi:MAG TPA: SDR family oxidoreductase [Candidatus Omnitrophota bacterium]|nr:SDR family oxidoreductase [Candidatus Omnitrophota bacterium]